MMRESWILPALVCLNQFVVIKWRLYIMKKRWIALINVPLFLLQGTLVLTTGAISLISLAVFAMMLLQ